MGISARVRVSGPLVSYVEGFATELTAQGYTDLSLANQLRLMADLSRWLDEGGIDLGDLIPERVEAFLAKRRRTHTQFISQRAMAPMLSYLRRVGAVPALVPIVSARGELLARYEAHLLGERGVAPARAALYLAVAEECLRGRKVAALSAADVTGLVRAHARRPGFSGWLTALRSALRFLFVSGETSTNLTYAVPSAPCWRQASLPKALESSEVDGMLATCDRRTIVGRRDHAVLLLMVRLGLRAGEVAALTLDDIDWKAGEIVVRGKGTTGRLPLPVDVGQSIVAYLRRRGRSESRAVFLKSRAPYGGGTAGMITQIAHSALRTAGISSGGAHRLRHTAATQMLRRGASLTEIAQVLRHRHIDTTAIYAKVDRDGLRGLAQPWPTGGLADADAMRALAQPWPGVAS
jgi:integrase/recombinase XerD